MVEGATGDDGAFARPRNPAAGGVFDQRRARSVMVAQLPVAAATAAMTFAIALLAPELLASGLFVTGVVIVLAVTALALVVPWGRFNPLWTMTLPVVDMVAIGLMRAGNETLGLSILLILPTIWLASVFRFLGAAVAFVLGSVAAWGPAVIDSSQHTVNNVARLVLIPMFLALIGITIAVRARRTDAQQQMLVRQGALVEEALEGAKGDRRFLHGVLNAVDFGIVGLAVDGTQTLANPRSAMLLGVGDNRVSRRFVFYSADRTTLVTPQEDPIARAMAGETFDRHVVWVGEPGTDQAALSISAQQIRSDSGAQAGAVVAFLDVTAEVQAQRAKEELVSAVSHELRTPLTSVIGYLDLAVDTPGMPEEALAHTRVAAHNAERMLQLISDMLVAASSERGTLAVQRTDADVGQIVREAIQGQQPRADARFTTISSTVRAGVRAFVDPDRFRQVLDNVLSNALKYGKTGGTVSVQLTGTEAELAITVSDDGTGISEADQAKLFNRFYRAPVVRGGVVSGTGLGLSISRAIVREHGGDIRLVSELGVGTTVTITVPRAAPTGGAA